VPDLPRKTEQPAEAGRRAFHSIFVGERGERRIGFILETLRPASRETTGGRARARAMGERIGGRCRR